MIFKKTTRISIHKIERIRIADSQSAPPMVCEDDRVSHFEARDRDQEEINKSSLVGTVSQDFTEGNEK